MIVAGKLIRKVGPPQMNVCRDGFVPIELRLPQFLNDQFGDHDYGSDKPKGVEKF